MFLIKIYFKLAKITGVGPTHKPCMHALNMHERDFLQFPKSKL